MMMEVIESVDGGVFAPIPVVPSSDALNNLAWGRETTFRWRGSLLGTGKKV